MFSRSDESLSKSQGLQAPRNDTMKHLSNLSPTLLKPIEEPHHSVYGATSKSKKNDFESHNTLSASLSESELREGTHRVDITSTTYDKSQTPIFDKHPTTIASDISSNLLVESYLPIENNHVQAILHRCGSHGAQFPIQAKLKQLNSLRGELQEEVDPLLQKALMLTAIYDSNNIEALTRNHNDDSPPAVTATVNPAPDSLQDSIAPSSTASLARCDSIFDSNCKCKEHLETLARIQKPVLHEDRPSMNVGFDYNRVSNTSSQAPVCDPVHSKELVIIEDNCVENRKDYNDAEEEKSCIVLEDAGLDRCGTTKPKTHDKKSNIEKNDVTTEETNDSNKTDQDISPDEYLPIDSCHLEAILEHGQEFGIQFPIQTKLNSKIEDPFEDRIKKRLNRRRTLMNRPQIKDTGNEFCSKSSEAINQDNERQHCTCCNCGRIQNYPSPHGGITNGAPVPILLYPYMMIAPFVPSEDLAKKMEQYETRSKNQDKTPGKCGVEDVPDLLRFEGATNNEDRASNPKSQVIMDLLKQSGGEEALRTIIGQSAKIPSHPGNSAKKRPFSVTSGDIHIKQDNHANFQTRKKSPQKKRSPSWGMCLQRR